MEQRTARALNTATYAGLVGLVFLLASIATTAFAGSKADGLANHATYTARLAAMNTSVTGTPTVGEAQFTVRGKNLVIDIHVTGAPPNITHWQHFHGFVDGRNAVCATSTADTNGDGIIDVAETEPASGTTMVPFDAEPAAMDVVRGDYPKASADGSYDYHAVVPLKKLETAFAKAFKGQSLQLDKRVVYIHGVEPDSRLPKSVASLGALAANITLPIACGPIERSN